MRIILSASNRDCRVADTIASHLRDTGHEVVLDGARLRPGDNISRKVRGESLAADVFLLIVSVHALRSKRLLQEFSTLALNALSADRYRIIPLLIDDSAVPSYLSDYAYIDLAGDFSAGLKNLDDALAAPPRQEIFQTPQRARQREENLANQLASIRTALRTGRLTLVCGAGVSVAAGIAEWNQLLLNLLESMIERLAKDHALELDRDAAEYLNMRHGASSLILGRYLKNNLGKDYGRKVRDTLYSKKPVGCDLVDAIVDIARPQRDGKPLDSIVTFNFDALLEENLSRANIRNRAIYSEAVRHDPNELPVYHVHGYLPRTGKIPEGVEIVFSEDAYHNQFIDPFSWSNLIQLNKLTQNTCLFVGVSLTDPNLRRLLDVAWRKNPDKTIGHFAIKKMPSSQGAAGTFDDLARLLEEQDANSLGVNVIWVDSYHDIPGIIRGIR